MNQERTKRKRRNAQQKNARKCQYKKEPASATRVQRKCYKNSRKICDKVTTKLRQKPAEKILSRCLRCGKGRAKVGQKAAGKSVRKCIHKKAESRIKSNLKKRGRKGQLCTLFFFGKTVFFISFAIVFPGEICYNMCRWLKKQTTHKKCRRAVKAMNEQALEARRAYKRKWAKANPDKVKAQQDRYWAKVAEREAAQAAANQQA